jgi:putative protease
MQKNKVVTGDSVELITPGKCGEGFVVEQMLGLDGKEIASAPHPSMLFKIKVPFEVHVGDILRSADR